METHPNNKILLDFLAARPAVMVSKVADHLKISRPHMTDIKQGLRRLQDKHVAPLKEFMKVYGYEG